jgi:hypothetical protein
MRSTSGISKEQDDYDDAKGEKGQVAVDCPGKRLLRNQPLVLGK